MYPSYLRRFLADELVASCGIGQSSAKSLVRLGCSIAIHHSSASSKPKAEELAAYLSELNPHVQVETFQADLSSYANVDALYKQVVATMGRNVDVLFANHGATGKVVGPNGDIGNISSEMFESSWRLHTGSTFRVCLTL